MKHRTERPATPADTAGRRDDQAEPRDVAQTFQEIVEREWGRTGRAPWEDPRYSCVAPFWI
ncbi:hypothetical protein HH310_13680 [Actinoplanes sp. TBRC 11911]|uniref:hypothetical protein n=1 Tax=Actinoplanes sp. TBRC 11911 TaxID=2729386 RepID=UPI00145E0448|nr:hypothetical protein [Actinoplanes sp. TBRC 11911]NMO52242.1 hypothetical protein [Actinoplanes sp. TBRC 11911]